jgi:transcriptional regulator with GAF, ATPase, and Fis domain
MIHLVVRSGVQAGQSFALDQDVVRVGRAPDNDVVLEDEHVSAHHLRIVRGPIRTVVEDLRSTRGTTLLSAGGSRRLDDATGLIAEVEGSFALELGSEGDITAIDVRVQEEEEARVVSIRRIEEILPVGEGLERDLDALRTLYGVQKRVGAAADLDEVVEAIGDGALQLVPRATHVTVILADDDAATGDPPVYVPVMTRVRGNDGAGRAPEGPVAIARSVFRKVLRERAAVLAADAPLDVAQAESIVGASIRSTAAVPLWRGPDILGVIQVDNRTAPGMLNARDLELLALFASNASLAVSNARLIRRLEAAQEKLKKENAFLRTREHSRGQEIIGRSAAITALLDQMSKVVDTRVTVLIEGETGTGKELIASAIHYRSRRRDKLFVAQNCAALPESLLESELFGHKRGSFTGATEDKKGLFDIADGGTLFLDEIGEVSMALQTKLLRVLQEGEIRPVGAARAHHVDVRIVAATNRNLEEEVRAGRFREDLYYRLKVFPLRVPPLRERREDIPLLAGAFLKRYAREIGRAVGGFSQQAMELLVGYDWPGNVRELQNEVQRLVIQLDDGAFVVPELLSERIRNVEGIVSRAGVVKGTLREMMDQVEKFLLIEALREHGNNKTNAARALGITREGLHKKLRALGI